MQNNKPFIYVCSPLRGAYEENLEKALEYCRFVYMRDGIPIAPHVYFTRFLNDQIPREREEGMEMGLELLYACHSLWTFGDVISEGMAQEIKLAEELGLEIKRFDSDCQPVSERSPSGYEVTYNFPKTKFVDENDIETQLEHIRSEFHELIIESVKNQTHAIDLEAADLYHSLETYFRMREKAGIDIRGIFQAVKSKNQKRGYYKNEN